MKMTINNEPTLPVSAIAPAGNDSNSETFSYVIKFGAYWLGISAVAILIDLFAVSKNNSVGPAGTGVCLAIGFAATSLGFLINLYSDYLKTCLPTNPCGGFQTGLNALRLSTSSSHNRDMLLSPLHAKNEHGNP